MASTKISHKQVFAEIAGWYGAAAILAAYTLVSFSLIAGNGLLFQVLNLTGALGIIVISTYKNIKQTIVLNIIWGIVAIVAIVNIFLQ